MYNKQTSGKCFLNNFITFLGINPAVEPIKGKGERNKELQENSIHKYNECSKKASYL